MADDAEDVLELEPDMEVEEAEPEELDDDSGDDVEDEDSDEGEEPEALIGFDDEEAAPASENDNKTIREMRKAMREKDRRLAELERAQAPQKVEVGEKPTLESCEYDEDKFEAALTSFHQRKAQAEAQEREAEERQANEAKVWEGYKATYDANKAELGVSDFDDAEEEVFASLSEQHVSLLMASGEKSAALVYALSKSPTKLAEFSKLNLLQAALMAGRLEGNLKMTKRKLPEPDRPVRGNAAPASADKQLAKLEAEAERTGDRTKLIAYRAKLKSKA